MIVTQRSQLRANIAIIMGKFCHDHVCILWQSQEMNPNDYSYDEEYME